MLYDEGMKAASAYVSKFSLTSRMRMGDGREGREARGAIY